MDTSVLPVVDDVSGKGNQATAVMAQSRCAIRTAALRSTLPSELLETVSGSLKRPDDLADDIALLVVRRR